MKVCNANHHGEIAFTEGDCPACARIEQLHHALVLEQAHVERLCRWVNRLKLKISDHDSDWLAKHSIEEIR